MDLKFNKKITLKKLVNKFKKIYKLFYYFFVVCELGIDIGNSKLWDLNNY